jgi:pimeloyl-ACP methyl ester carboxylesterase
MHTGRITTEGDDLHFEVRGKGEPLLMIPGGGGDGGSYAAVAEILADEFTVITFDRRANARSTMNAPQNFEVSQQSRDAAAVLRAAGVTSAFVFGNSSGAVIALDMAKTQPQAVRTVVAHEPPVARVLPDGKRWQRRFAAIYATSFRFGPTVAMIRFALAIGIDFSFRNAFAAARSARRTRETSGQRYLPESVATRFFVQHELVPITSYLPDVATIRGNRVKVFMAAGKRSLDKRRVYARAARVLAEQLGSELIVFPGHHGSFMDRPDEWAAVLRKVLRQ